MKLVDFARTTPFYVHDTGPAPLCGTLECRQGRGAVCATGCGAYEDAERIAAQAEGARAEMSAAWANSGHAPLEETHRNVEPWSWLAAGAALVLLALIVAHVVGRLA